MSGHSLDLQISSFRSVALERSGLKFQAQFARALPRSMKFCMRWSACDLGIFLPVLVGSAIHSSTGVI
jgi:hypothetical protein